MEPGSEAVDAFTQDWSNDNNWLCPPVALIVRTVKHLQMCKASGTLIIPEWPSSYFWPFINPVTGVMSSLVKEWFPLPRFNPVFRASRGQAFSNEPSVFVGTPSFRVLALRLVM